MINEAIFTKMVIDETCYEDNCDDEGSPYWTPDEIRDPDELVEIVCKFWLMTPPVKGRRGYICKLEDHPILWGEVMSLINTMDLEELAGEVEEEIDSCIAYAEAKELARKYY